MAVLVEALSVVVRRDAIDQKFPGGWDAFANAVPNGTLCADAELARVGFMTPGDVEAFVKSLESAGLRFLANGCAVDIAVVDQLRGPTTRCDWLEFGHVELGQSRARVAACRRAGSSLMAIITPEGWIYECSLSQSFGYAQTEHVDRSLKFLRHERGMDVYLNTVTGKEVYVGRAGGFDSPSR